MTATEVNGQPVVSDEPTPSGMYDRGGRMVFWRQTRKLTLADGSVAYGCSHDGCEFVSWNKMSIRPHLTVHRTTPRKRPNIDANGHVPEELAAVVAQLSNAQRLAEECQEWKARALDAEKSLRAMRRALGVKS